LFIWSEEQISLHVVNVTWTKLNSLAFINNGFISNHQFGFREGHSTIDQTQRIVQRINGALENKQYFSTAFLDISQAFDKVWYIGLLYKLRLFLSLNYFILLRSYLHSGHFLVKFKSEYTELSSVKAGVLQGSVLGPVIPVIHCISANLNRIYNCNICRRYCSISHTDRDPDIASQELQTNPDAIQKWLLRWRIEANESTSVHVTFTARRETCPPVHINSIPLPQQDVKYLGLHLDRRLTWRKHIFTKQKQLGMTLTKMHWLLGRKSKLSTSNNILIHKAILKPISPMHVWGQPPMQGLSGEGNAAPTSTCCNCHLAEGEIAHASNYWCCRRVKEVMQRWKSQEKPRTTTGGVVSKFIAPTLSFMRPFEATRSKISQHMYAAI
jgi:hypothetical protein